MIPSFRNRRNALGPRSENSLSDDALEIYDELKSRGAISAEYAAVPARIQKELGEVK